MSLETEMPKTFEEFTTALVEGFHESAAEEDKVYNVDTAEWAINSTALAIFSGLNQLPDKGIIDAVREMAKTIPK